jgi:hypothetical protein
MRRTLPSSPTNAPTDLLRQVVAVLCSYVETCLATPDLHLGDDSARDFISHVSALVAAANGRLGAVPPESSAPAPRLPPRDSAILTELPTVLQEFEDRRWTLLYRGSRDGFGAADFHLRCDGHAGTLTVVRTVSGGELLPSCVFGGYAAGTWDSVSGYKRDTDRCESFLFNARAARSGTARRYRLISAPHAIYANVGYGPTFGNGHDLHICNACDRVGGSGTALGTGYSSGAGEEEDRYFAITRTFLVQEIEVFEISPEVETDET